MFPECFPILFSQKLEPVLQTVRNSNQVPDSGSVRFLVDVESYLFSMRPSDDSETQALAPSSTIRVKSLQTALA